MSSSDALVSNGAGHEISFATADIQRCPFAAYDKLRNENPVYRDPLTGNFVLTRYADVRKALLQTRIFSSQAGAINLIASSPELGEIFEAKGWAHRPAIQQMDPPDHKAKRSLVDKAFANWNIQQALPFIEGVIDDLLARFEERGSCEFVSEFAIPLTLTVIAHQLGVLTSDPVQFQRDVSRLRHWSDCMIEMLSPVLTPERARELVEEAVEFQHFCAANVERVRARPDETLLSKLTEVIVDDQGRPDMPELIAMTRALLVAGNETTRFALASGVKALIENPKIADDIRDNPALIDPFVEEMLRTVSPVQTLFRTTTQDVEVSGVTIPAGSKVEVRFGAANRDPDCFAMAGEIDLERPAGQSHLAFGAGVHACIGMQLARAELRHALGHILNRLQNLRAATGDDSFEYSSMYISYGLTRLNLAFDRRRAPS